MYQELADVWAELTAPGQQFEITTVEVRGHPVRTYANAPGNLRDIWLLSAGYADRDYVVYGDERWTYAQAHRQVEAIAAWLRANGVGRGDRVALAMRNYPEWVLAYWATVAMGAVVVGMNAWWVTDEMAYGLQDGAPRVLIADQERLDRVQPIRGDFPDLLMVGVRLQGPVDGVTPWSEVLATPGSLPEATIHPDEDACIFYTSGTTGRPKGAQLTHRGCVNNVMNIVFAATASGQALARANGEPPPNPEDAPIGSSLLTTPLFHVTANNCGLQPQTLMGGKVTLMYKWDPLEALELIQREGVTAMSGVPTMARELISHPDFDRYDTSTLLSLGGGGAQLQPDLVGKIDEKVATARPGTGYGMTETCGIITSISGDFFLDRPESCGRAMPNFEAKCVDAEGNALPAGEVGELWVRGAPVIAGYLNRPDATAETITDGWLHTGDVARMDDDGFIYIVDRLKDMVLRGGENVYCAEVESAIFDHPAVAECTVFGVPDDRLGEEVGAAVFLKDGANATADDLRSHCAQRIAKHKVPRYIWLLDEPLPRNANGKFLKRQLRDELSVDRAA
jgi:long-chain acyl-CoA synthetase